MIRASPRTPEGYYAALRPLTGAAKRRNTRGVHEHVDTKIESGVRLRVVLAKVRRVVSYLSIISYLL